MANILLIGCGRMGRAMATSWRAEHRVLAYDPAATLPEGVEKLEAIDAATLPDDLIVVLAVKPQMFASVAPLLAPLAGRGALFVSIMAGISVAGLGMALGGAERIVRTMPNTPAAIGRGITGAFATPGVGSADRALVEALLRAAGAVAWLGDEAAIDLVTGVSGSGPAYFFRLVEALAAAGVAAGLSEELSMALARATFTGAAALAESRDVAIGTLRTEVTSPGGTTAAGLAVMDAEGAIDRMMKQVVAAAVARARELAV